MAKIMTSFFTRGLAQIAQKYLIFTLKINQPWKVCWIFPDYNFIWKAFFWRKFKPLALGLDILFYPQFVCLIHNEFILEISEYWNWFLWYNQSLGFKLVQKRVYQTPWSPLVWLKNYLQPIKKDQHTKLWNPCNLF